MNCSRLKRTSLLLVLALAACAQPRDQATRFSGAEQSVNVFQIERQRISPYIYRGPARTFTMRETVLLPAPGVVRGLQPATRCVYAAMVGSFEMYWDGELIGRSGTPASPGPLDNFFVIPSHANNAGPHQLEFRVFLPDIENNWFHGVVIGDYQRMIRSRIVGQVVPLSGFAVFVVIGIYYLTLSFAMRRRAAAITFALLCFAAALLAVAETWRWTVGYTYDVQSTRLAIIGALTFCVSLLLPAFFVLELELQRRWIWLGAVASSLIAVGAIPLSSDERCLAFFWSSMILSGVVLATAARRRGRRTIPGALALAILVVALLSGGYSFSDNTFFIAFCLAIACLLVSMAIELRRERRERESLELQLLHKMIEPHFVMNTLTAVMEWLEHDPKTGVQFLEAFADELRMFSSMSHDATVPISDEIALCRSHLAVMQCRKGNRFHLRADSIDPSAAIPPAVLHTLVENALTHNRYDADVEFVLTEEKSRDTRRYVFDAPCSAPASAETEGTGLRYVKARLEESYPGRWTLQTARAGSVWRTTIEVPA
jgi:hypothetical protein